MNANCVKRAVLLVTVLQCYFSYCFSVSVSAVYMYVLRNIIFDSQSIIKLIVHFQKCSVS